MKTIATLGPKGTFSDAATAIYIGEKKEPFEVKYFSSIKKALNTIGKTCDLGVLPIENLSEGFVSLVLDHLIDANIFIVGEILLPIQFSFVGNTKKLSDIKRLFVQFVAKGQCSEFIESLGDIEIITTESNIKSLEMVQKNEEGAVVPVHSYKPDSFSFVIKNINDYENNQTRFLAFANNMALNFPDKNAKTTIVVMNDNDRPGLLENILSSFSKRKINLTSIVSRPTRQEFGKYHFFIDFKGHMEDANVSKALKEINSAYKVKIMGSYVKAKNL